MPLQLFPISILSDPDDVAQAIRGALQEPCTVFAPPLDHDYSGIVVDKGTLWTGPQISAVQAAITTSPLFSQGRQQQKQVDAIPPILKAIVLALIDQLNVIRAALPIPLPPITPLQALNAIRAKAGTL